MMVDYAEVSDFEINCKVARSLGEVFTIPTKRKPNPYLYVGESTIQKLNADGTCVERYIVKDYCNNPADAWPIIVENRISINFDSSPDGDAPVEWVTANTEYFSGYLQVNKALRAAMIVFLMMQDEKNG